MKAHWGVRALQACVFSPLRVCGSRPVHPIVLSQSFLVDLGPLGAMASSPVLVVTELRELVFQLERPTYKHSGVCVRSILAFLAPFWVCWSRAVHPIVLSQSFLVDMGPLGARRQARFWW